jgi:hypothetical protein
MTMKRLPILVGFMAVPIRARANERLRRSVRMVIWPVKGPLAGRSSPWPATESPATPPAPGVETNFPVGPASAKKLGYDPQEIDALPPSVTESFCGVGTLLGLGEAPAENEQPLSDRTCGEPPHVLVHFRV